MAAVLVLLAALLTAAELLVYGPVYFEGGADVITLVRLSAQFLVPAAAYGVLAVFLFRGVAWARTAVTALAVVSVATEATAMLAVAVADGDATALMFLVPGLALLLAVALLWSAPSRAWYGPPA